MIEVRVTKTARYAGRAQDWFRYDDEQQTFEGLVAAKAYVEEQYWYSRTRRPIYQETAHGAVQSGWMYCYKTKERGKTTYQRDWVTYAEVSRHVVDIRTRRTA